jgi:hypothetical protein
MTKSTTSQTAKMALFLPTGNCIPFDNSPASVNRWCVSGTPIVNGINDLHGLLLFLKCGDYWKKSTSELLECLQFIMWRHAKADVMAEISIPPPTETIKYLKFDEIESFCYTKLLELLQTENPEVGRTALKKFYSAPFVVARETLIKKDKKRNVFKTVRADVSANLWFLTA